MKKWNTHTHTHTHTEMYNNELLTLTVDRGTGPLLLSRDINKYCKFLWRNSSTANYNRCVCIVCVCVCVCVCVASAHETHSFRLFCFRLLLDKGKENIQNTHVRVYFSDLNECPYHYIASFSDFYRKLNTDIFLSVTK